MSAFILLAPPAFTAETNVFQHALIRLAKNERVRFVAFSHYFLENKGFREHAHFEALPAFAAEGVSTHVDHTCYK